MTGLTPAEQTLLTVSQLAERHQVSKQAVSRRAHRLAEKHPDFAVRRDAEGRITGIPVAQYEDLVGVYGDSAKRPGAAAPAAPASGDQDRDRDSLDDARLLAARVGAERAALQLAREKGELVRRDRMEAALEEAGLAIAAVLDRLPNAADELALSVSQDGAPGLRTALKRLARQLRGEAAEALRRLHDAAPAEDADAEAPLEAEPA